MEINSPVLIAGEGGGARLRYEASSPSEEELRAPPRASSKSPAPAPSAAPVSFASAALPKSARRTTQSFSSVVVKVGARDRVHRREFETTARGAHQHARRTSHTGWQRGSGDQLKVKRVHAHWPTHLRDEIVGRFNIAVDIRWILGVEKGDGFRSLRGHVQSTSPRGTGVRVREGMDYLVEGAAAAVLHYHPELGWCNAYLRESKDDVAGSSE